MRYPQNAQFNILGIVYGFAEGKPDVGDMVIDEKDGTCAILEWFHDESHVSLRCPFDKQFVEIGVSVERCKLLKPVAQVAQNQLN